MAESFGVDQFELGSSRTWSKAAENRDRFDLVIEAVGHQVGTLNDMIDVAAPGGNIVYFGNPDDQYYPVNFGGMMDKELVLYTGRTPQKCRRQALVRAQKYLGLYPAPFDRYVTDVLPVEQAQAAYELASRWTPGRLKVVIEARA